MTELFQAIDQYVSEAPHREAIEQACDACEAELRARPGLPMTWRLVASALRLTGTAASLNSLWVFAFSPGGESETHKHSNSTQYTRSWRGRGRLRIGEPETAVVLSLPPLETREAGQKWAVLPAGVFHQAIASDDGWCVVSFQTAAADDLQEELYSGVILPYLHQS
jgi:hypothetical protein